MFSQLAEYLGVSYGTERHAMSDLTQRGPGVTGPPGQPPVPGQPVPGQLLPGQPARAVPGAAPARVTATLILASIGAFVTSLDVVVVSTALPQLRAHLGASLSDLEWTINAYNLAFASLMLTGAALGDRFGRKRVYVIGLALFTVSSIACATAGSAGALIAARSVQGAGAAIVLPLSLTLISEAFPLEKRGTAIGIWGGITGLGVATAPLLGGAIIQGISWQWIFWINVPVGVAAAIASAFLLTESRGPRPRLDLVGLPLISAGLLALVWAPVRAPSVGWGNGEVIGALAAGAVLIACFVFWEARAPLPMLPLAYFRRRAFSAAGAVAFPFSFALIGSVFWIAQLLQVGMGYSPLASGLRMLVFTMMPMLFAPLAGIGADRAGNRPFMAGGLLLMGGGFLWLALTLQAGVGYASLIGPFIVAGIGISFVFPTLANAAVGSVPLADSGVAAGANNTLREAGGLFGVAVLAAVFTAHGGYASPAAFMHGVRYALIVAAAVALAGAIPAVLGPSRAAALASAAEPVTGPGRR
jgi:EmrB/QacA subfamily drug resistance transporter